MPPLQETIGSTGAKLRPLSVGKGADLPAVRQDLAAQRHVAANVGRIRRDCRRGAFVRSVALVPGARWRDPGGGVVAAGVRVYCVARHVCDAGKFSIEMRMA